MRYFWCWVFPPLGMLTCGRPGLALVAFVMCCTIVGWIPAALWSYLVAAEFYADKRTDKLARAMSRGGRGRSPAGRSDRNPFDFDS